MAYSGSGSGTGGDPYIITTAAQLQEMADYDTASFKLGNDIDASVTRTWNQGGVGYEGFYYGFAPVTFYGDLDGNSKKITNLYINRTTANAGGSGSIGLFAQISSSTISDLTLENIDYTGDKHIGGLAAKAATSVVVSNCHVTGNIEFKLGGASNRGVGGVFGEINSGAQAGNTIDDCSSTIQIVCTTDITNINNIGGFAGIAGSTGWTITNCQASGSLSLAMDATGASQVNVGGFIGNSSAKTYVSCVSSTEVSVNITGATILNIGGFSGIGAGTVTYSFAYGSCTSLSADAAYVGGFYGYDAGGSTYTYCGAEGNIENYSEHATKNCAGGFSGYSIAGSPTNCYAKGSVNVAAGIGHADAAIGGFCGNSSSPHVNCYSVGEVYSSGSPTNGGGFVGVTDDTETACFYDNQTSGYTTDGGDAVGKSTTLMQTESTFTDVSWDFDDVWYLPTGTRAPGLPSTVWLSEVGDYENHEAGVNDADAFSLTIPTQDIILWNESLEALLVGTAGDEWTIGSNRLQTPISPTNFAVKQQSTYGSANIQPQKVNEVILFVDFVKRKIREMTFAVENEKYVSPDMTSLAEHITETGVVCMAHQKNPDSILWCVLTDGSLISMVYDRQQNVIAWSDHPVDGTVLSVCVTPSTNEDDVWISVKRTINGSDALYVEKFATRIQGDIEDSFFIDSGIATRYDAVYYGGELVYYDNVLVTYSGAAATDEMGGFGHLIGEQVAVLVAGSVVYDGTEAASEVDSNGVVTLDSTTTSTDIQIGLPYTALIQPMRIVQNSQLGSSMGSNTRIKDMKVTFLNSLGVEYGDSESSLFSFNFSDERLEDAAYVTGLFSGDVPVNMAGGFSVENPIIIRSDQPLPMTVKSIVAEFEQTGR